MSILTYDYTPLPVQFNLQRGQSWNIACSVSDISNTIDLNDYDITAVIFENKVEKEKLSLGAGISVSEDGTLFFIKKDWIIRTEVDGQTIFTPELSQIATGIYDIQVILTDANGREITVMYFYIQVKDEPSPSSVARASSNVQVNLTLDGGIFVGLDVAPVSDRIEWRTFGTKVQVRQIGEPIWHDWVDLYNVPFPTPLGGYNATTNLPALTAIPPVNLTEGSFYDITTPGTLGFSGVNFNSGTTVNAGDQLKKNGTQWLLIATKFLTEKKFLKRTSVPALTAQEINLLNALYTLDCEITAANINDDWRIKYVATVPRSGDLVANFKYSLIIRNYTTGIDYRLVNQNADFVAAPGHTFYYGTVTISGVTVKYNIEIDWNYLLSLGATYQFYNEGSTNNLKIEVGVHEKTSKLEDRTTSLEAKVIRGSRVSDLEAQSKLFANPVGNYVTQAIVLTTDRYYRPNGLLSNSISGFKCARISVLGVDRIRVSGTISGNDLWFCIFLDSDEKVISRYKQGENNVTEVVPEEEINLPAGTVAVLLNSTTAGNLAWKKLIPMTKAAEKSSVDSIATRTSAIESAIAGFVEQTIVVTEYTYYNPNGVLTSFPTQNFKSSFVDCLDSDRFLLTTNISGTELHLAMFVDASGAIISRINRGVNGQAVPYVDVLIIPPTGTVRILFSCSPFGDLSLKKLQLQSNYATKPYVDSSIAKLNYLNTVESEEIHVSGTSIPEGGKHYELACTRLGATLINKALGSSMVRSAKKDGTFVGINWRNYCYAYTHSIAKKQEIIDNWSTVRTSLTGSTQDPVPTTLTTAEQTKILGASYQNRLLPYLNGTFPMPSVFVFDHGHNDYAYDTYNDFITMPSNTRDVNTFIGGVNFLIDLILQYNPRARIAFVGHYENDRKTQISLAQTVLAEHWDFPFLKLWEKLGWSQKVVAGTASIRATLPYSNFNTGTGDMTILNIWLPDDLHIGSDTTGKAKEHAAKPLQEFLRVL